MKPFPFVVALLLVTFAPAETHGELRAGAAKVDVTPQTLPVIRNGGFIEASDSKVVDPLHARCLVLDDRVTRLAIVVVDSCMLPRDLCDEAKRLASDKTGIPLDRILISATHCHSAPSSMNYCLGSRVDPRYRAFLPGKLVEAIVQANASLQPAKAAWGRVDAAEFTACRRWSFLKGNELVDPFGNKTVRANMHPGHGNENAVGPTGPADPWLSFLSVQSPDGRPLSVLANFSMHYFSGHPGVSADYAGLFSESLAKRLAPGDESFVGIMSQGTSGDSWWGDYSRDKRRTWSMQDYTGQLVDMVAKRLAKLEHSEEVPLGMAESRPEFFRRTPDAARLKWARDMLEKMDGQAAPQPPRGVRRAGGLDTRKPGGGSAAAGDPHRRPRHHGGPMRGLRVDRPQAQVGQPAATDVQHQPGQWRERLHSAAGTAHARWLHHLASAHRRARGQRRAAHRRGDHPPA